MMNTEQQQRTQTLSPINKLINAERNSLRTFSLKRNSSVNKMGIEIQRISQKSSPSERRIIFESKADST